MNFIPPPRRAGLVGRVEELRDGGGLRLEVRGAGDGDILEVEVEVQLLVLVQDAKSPTNKD